VTLIETLERVGIPKEYSKKKFLPDLDWSEIDNYDIDDKIEKTLGTEREEYGMGMGGEMGYGLGPGGVPPLPSQGMNYGSQITPPIPGV